ncbi:MAG: hypothetical protein HY870_09490, partial [Chloroflexi bacterium]|nr:hypothetical protein [Chloroflexota bacterium]
ASGLLVDAVGYRGVFGLALVLLSVGLWALSRLQEPRKLARLAASDSPASDLKLDQVEE